jgi:delta 1-pyrroline-5-carboxylate dehydrogenase
MRCLCSRSPRERSAVLSRFYDLFGEREKELSDVLMKESGKTLSDATAEVWRYSISLLCQFTRSFHKGEICCVVHEVLQ